MKNTILNQLKEEIAKKFNEEDLKFYRGKINELQETFEGVPDDEKFDYAFYKMLKDLKDLPKEDVGLLYIALLEMTE